MNNLHSGLVLTEGHESIGYTRSAVARTASKPIGTREKIP